MYYECNRDNKRSSKLLLGKKKKKKKYMTKDQTTKEAKIERSMWPGAAELPVFKRKANPSISCVSCKELVPTFYVRFSIT